MTTEIQVTHSEQLLSFNSNPRDIGEFLKSLLGQPQEIRGKFHGIADIDKRFFINILNVIDQRLLNQNDHDLLGFKATIHFHDNSERVIYDLNSFNAFDDTRDVISTGVDIQISYLVKFKNKEKPEKQEIFINTRLSEDFEKYKFFNPTGVLITYQILHTERTWGDDILNIITNECKKAIKNDNSIYRLCMLLIGFASLIIFLALPVYLESNLISENYNKAITTLAEVKSNNSNDIDIISKKIDGIIIFLKQISQPQEYKSLVQLFFVSMGFISMFLFLKISLMSKESFITIGETSKNYRDDNFKKDNRIYIYTILAFIFNVVAGIVGNYFFTKIFL